MATILIIDDDPATLGLLRTRLEKAGHAVRDAKDGKEGLDKAEREPPDLIFLDVRMPKVDGWEVCRTLKSNSLTAHCPVVMLTGCSQDVQELYGLQCGADEYITKPWDARQLMEITQRLLQQSTAFRDARSEVSQKRIRHYIQRVVRMVGNLPKNAPVQEMSSQLLQRATTLVSTYQLSIANSGKMAQVNQEAGELLYWLELLRESKASDDLDLPLLIAEGNVLKNFFEAALKKSARA
jgi:DNA-binding response OmpR family regulator